MSNKNCEACPLKQALMDIASVLEDFLDNSKRLTWSEQACYRNRIIEIHKMLKSEKEDGKQETS